MASAGFEPTIPAMKLLQTYALGRGCPTFFYGKVPHLLLWAGSMAARGQITVNGILNRQKYCVIFIAYIVLKCVRGSHNAALRAAGWTPMP